MSRQLTAEQAEAKIFCVTDDLELSNKDLSGKK